MARVLIIESGDDWRALSVPEDWSTDDVDRYLNGMAYGRAAVVAVESIACDRCNGRGYFWPGLGVTMDGQMLTPKPRDCAHCNGSGIEPATMAEPDSFLPLNGGEYGGGSV